MCDYDKNAWDGSSYNDRYGMTRDNKYNGSQTTRQGRNSHNNSSNAHVDQLNTNDVSLNVVGSPLSRVHDKSRVIPPLPTTPQNAMGNNDKDVIAELLQLQ